MQQQTNQQINDSILNSYEDGEVVFTETKLPSRFFPKQVVNVKFLKDHPPITATVRGVHFYSGKIKYDLDLWLDDDTETRIYNVDSAFVTDIKAQA